MIPFTGFRNDGATQRNTFDRDRGTRRPRSRVPDPVGVAVGRCDVLRVLAKIPNIEFERVERPAERLSLEPHLEVGAQSHNQLYG